MSGQMKSILAAAFICSPLPWSTEAGLISGWEPVKAPSTAKLEQELESLVGKAAFPQAEALTKWRTS